MGRYLRAEWQTDWVYSLDWGFGTIESRCGDNVVVDFHNEKRAFNFLEYKHRGRVIYIIPERMECIRYMKDRRITSLVHFTPIENLENIFVNGIIPRAKQIQPGVWTDDYRLDGHEDCSCFSLSYPNYCMLYQKRKAFEHIKPNGKKRFAILTIDPMALTEIDEFNVAYYQTNAAAEDNRNTDFANHIGIDALKSLFDDCVMDSGIALMRSQQELSSEYTTHPQAEVMIRGTVPSKYITGITLVDPTASSYLPVQIPNGISIDYNENMFWPQDKWTEYESRRYRKHGNQARFYDKKYQAVC